MEQVSTEQVKEESGSMRTCGWTKPSPAVPCSPDPLLSHTWPISYQRPRPLRGPLTESNLYGFLDECVCHCLRVFMTWDVLCQQSLEQTTHASSAGSYSSCPIVDPHCLSRCDKQWHTVSLIQVP
jgi:hypothetical protein